MRQPNRRLSASTMCHVLCLSLVEIDLLLNYWGPGDSK